MARSFPIRIVFEEAIDSGIVGSDGKKQEFKELIINRRPTGGEYRTFPISNPTIDDYQRVGSKITNLPLHVIRKMSPAKTMQLVEVLSDFLLE